MDNNLLEELKNVKFLKQECERIKRKLKEIGTTYQSPSFEPKYNTSDNGGIFTNVENKMLFIASLEQEYYKMLMEMDSKILELTNIIYGLDNHLHKSILIGYYLEGKTLEKISEEQNFSFSWIRNSHIKAKKAIENHTRKY